MCVWDGGSWERGFSSFPAYFGECWNCPSCQSGQIAKAASFVFVFFYLSWRAICHVFWIQLLFETDLLLTILQGSGLIMICMVANNVIFGSLYFVVLL